MVTTSTSVQVNFGSSAGSVTVKASNACGSGTAKSLAIAFNCRETVEAMGSFNFAIHPNPANTETEVAFLSDERSSYSIELTDLVGKTVYSKSGTAYAGENRFSLNVQSLAKGVYLMQVRRGEERACSRLVVE